MREAPPLPVCVEAGFSQIQSHIDKTYKQMCKVV